MGRKEPLRPLLPCRQREGIHDHGRRPPRRPAAEGGRLNMRTKFEASLDKRDELKRSEAAGEVADSMNVRLALMGRVHSGEITLAQAQAELKKIQRGAKAAG